MAGGAAGPGRPVRPLQVVAHGAHGLRATDRVARFERIQDDERDHAEWILTATVDEVDGGATLVTDLLYTGTLWGSSALQRVLDDEIGRGKEALRQLVSAEPTR